MTQLVSIFAKYVRLSADRFLLRCRSASDLECPAAEHTAAQNHTARHPQRTAWGSGIRKLLLSLYTLDRCFLLPRCNWTAGLRLAMPQPVVSASAIHAITHWNGHNASQAFLYAPSIICLYVCPRVAAPCAPMPAHAAMQGAGQL